MPGRLHLGMGGVDRDVPVPGRLLGGGDVPTRLVDADAHEVQRRGNRLQLLVGEPRGLAARRSEVGVGVAALEHDRHEAGVALARGCLRRLDVLGRVDDRDGDADVLGEPHLGAGRAAGADRLDGQAVAEHGVVADLLELGIRKPQARRGSQVHRVAAADLDVDALVAPFHEGGELVDGEVVLDAGRRLRRLRRRAARRPPWWCPWTASRHSGPGGSGAGPSGTGWQRARCRPPAARPLDGCRSRGPWGWERRCPPGRSGARRSRTGRRSRRCPASARRRPCTGGSGRWPHRRCRRWRCGPACGRRCPRSRGPCRPRSRRPRSGTPTWPRPSRTRWGTGGGPTWAIRMPWRSCTHLHRPCVLVAMAPAQAEHVGPVVVAHRVEQAPAGAGGLDRGGATLPLAACPRETGQNVPFPASLACGMSSA
jgi:hypothetical protein